MMRQAPPDGLQQSYQYRDVSPGTSFRTPQHLWQQSAPRDDKQIAFQSCLNLRCMTLLGKIRPAGEGRKEMGREAVNILLAKLASEVCKPQDAAAMAGRLCFSVTLAANKVGRAFIKPSYAQQFCPMRSSDRRKATAVHAFVHGICNRKASFRNEWHQAETKNWLLA